MHAEEYPSHPFMCTHSYMHHPSSVTPATNLLMLRYVRMYKIQIIMFVCLILVPC